MCLFAADADRCGGATRLWRLCHPEPVFGGAWPVPRPPAVPRGWHRGAEDPQTVPHAVRAHAGARVRTLISVCKVISHFEQFKMDEAKVCLCLCVCASQAIPGKLLKSISSNLARWPSDMRMHHVLIIFSFFLRSSIGGVAYVTVLNSSATWAATFRLRGC